MNTNKTALVTRSSDTTASKLLVSEKYSDLTIICYGRGFKVHKVILCPQSDVISKMCDNDMQERMTGTIEHKEFDEDTMQRMIEFAYTKNYGVTRRPKFSLAKEVEHSTASIDALAIEDASVIEASRFREETMLHRRSTKSQPSTTKGSCSASSDR